MVIAVRRRRRDVTGAAFILERPDAGLFSGHFCSWFVTELYNELGLTLLEVDADRITPGAIDRSKRLYSVDSRIRALPLAVPPHLQAVRMRSRPVRWIHLTA